MSWVRMRRGKDDFCLVRYEDLLADPADGLKKRRLCSESNPTPER